MANLDERIVFEPTGFDYVNPKAKVVIVGITPGNSQLDGSRDGMSPLEIKRKYAFAGSMRHWLVNMLDYIGINQLLKIETCSSLWGDDFDKFLKVAKSLFNITLLDNGYVLNSSLLLNEGHSGTSLIKK